MKKRMRLVGILLGVFAVLLAVYFIFIRPAYLDSTSNEPKKISQYLFDPVTRDHLLAVTVHPTTGQRYGIERLATSVKEVTDGDVEEFLKKFLQDKGMTELTAAYAREELNKSGYDADKMTDKDCLSEYRRIVKAGLEAVAENNATFYVRQDGLAVADANNLKINAQRLAELIVGAGQVFLYDTVVSKNPEKEALKQVSPEEYEKLLLDYGIDGKTWVDVTDDTGKVRRILVGDQNTTGNGYFVALEGGDVIGTTNTSTLGDFIEASGATLVECAVIAPMDNQYAYNYVKNFAIFRSQRILAGDDAAKGLTLAWGDIFGFTYTLSSGDKEVTGLSEVMVHLEEKGDPYTILPMTAETAKRFWGMPLGKCDLRYEVTLGEEYGKELAGKTVSVLVSSIDYVQKPAKEVATISHIGLESYIDAPYEKFKFEGNGGLSVYLPDTTVAMKALEKVAKMEGTVVALGFLWRNEDEEGNVTEQVYDRELMDKYGLWRCHVSLEMPYYEGRDPMEEEPVGYVPQEFYISERQPDGSFYVGSVLFNVIIQVTSDAVDFSEYSPYDWIKKDVFSLTRDSTVKILYEWNYGEGLSDTYRFDMDYGERTNSSGEKQSFLRGVAIYKLDKATGNFVLFKKLEDLRTDTEAAKGEAAEKNGVNDFTEMFLRMVYMTYAGELEIPEGETEAFLEEHPAALTVTFTLVTGEGDKTIDVKIAFRPYTGGRCAVTYDGVTSFYTFNSSLRTTALNFLRVLAGEKVDSQDRY